MSAYAESVRVKKALELTILEGNSVMSIVS